MLSLKKSEGRLFDYLPTAASSLRFHWGTSPRERLFRTGLRVEAEQTLPRFLFFFFLQFLTGSGKRKPVNKAGQNAIESV